MFQYIPIEEELHTSDLGTYRSFGICVKDERKYTLMILSDISTDKEFVVDLAIRCTDGGLAPDHLIDVVLNSI